MRYTEGDEDETQISILLTLPPNKYSKISERILSIT